MVHILVSKTFCRLDYYFQKDNIKSRRAAWRRNSVETLLKKNIATNSIKRAADY